MLINNIKKFIKVINMRKGIAILIALAAFCIAVGVVSAEEWSFSTGTATNSDGGSIEINNNEVKIQDETFKLPDGYKEDEDARVLAEETGDGKGAKISACKFENGDKNITIKVIFSDGGITNVTGPDGAKDATIGGQAGFLTKEDDGVLFDYNKDDKLIEISAPSQEELESLFK
jgi:hypothetical protein